MATKKQKRAAGIAKHEAFMAEQAELGRQAIEEAKKERATCPLPIHTQHGNCNGSGARLCRWLGIAGFDQRWTRARKEPQRIELVSHFAAVGSNRHVSDCVDRSIAGHSVVEAIQAKSEALWVRKTYVAVTKRHVR